MDEIESVLRYSELLSIYQNLLSKAQREMLEDYYLCNLSFSEIAENRQISRSAVEDAIKKGKKKLDLFEEEICSLKAINALRELKQKDISEELKKEIEDIERILHHGIWIIEW